MNLQKQVECESERDGEEWNQLPQSIYFSLHSFLLISSLIMLCMESDIDRYELSEIRVRLGRCAGKQITLLPICKGVDERLQQNHLMEVEQTDKQTEKERELNTVTKELCGMVHRMGQLRQPSQKERARDVTPADLQSVAKMVA